MGRNSPPPPLSPQLNLPPRLTVPPLPPRIHRRLALSCGAHGLVLRPVGLTHSHEGVLVRWGPKGKVEALSTNETQEGEVEIGGVIGIVRLWDVAYLLVFLPPTKPATCLFPNDPFGPEPEFPAHEVYTLGDVHAVPLAADRAAKQIKHLGSILAKRAPKPPPKGKLDSPSKSHGRTGSRTGLNLKWTMPWLSTEQESAPSEDDEDSDSDTDSSDMSSFTRSRRASSVAPEADETPCDLPPEPDTAEARVQRRISFSWSKFAPKVKPGLIAVRAAVAMKGKRGTTEGSTTAEDPADPPPEAPQAPEAPEVKITLEDREPLFPDLEEAITEPLPRPVSPAKSEAPSIAPTLPPVDAPQRRELEGKIIRQITREFGSGEFYYSFDFDLTHTLQHKRNRLASRTASTPLLEQLLKEVSPSQTKPFCPSPIRRNHLDPRSEAGSGATTPISPVRCDPDIVEPDVHVPLWRRVDRRFFWNEWLLRDFIDQGLHAYVLPVSQGYVQASSFKVPIAPAVTDEEPPEPIPVDIVLISRRSRDRAGLRYQRRGIDDQGHVANFVETEMMVRAKAFGKVSLFSFVQIRGSIPLKWSQTPWSMKPPPELDQPVEQTYSVANLHFDELRARYGPVTIINLSEQQGKEADVTNGYAELVKSLDRKDLTYVPFDFHAKCRGMKWERVSELVNEVDLADMGYSWSLQGDLVRKQHGVFRTNCIDCLDRTNVVQSAVARSVLNQMLMQVGIVLDPTTCNVESVFNDIWANNGDMISLCYAHTSALKGDFVRTGKRDLQGMLHDGVSSLSRMFYGAVSDFFAQAVISFMLGNRNLGVFNEFLENLQSTDSSHLIKQSRVRAAAIETSSARVLRDGELRVAGWTLLSPKERNTKLSTQLEEKVLLLTKSAIYVVSFNYSLEKVNEYTRIPLKSIVGIEKGAYILSALQEAGRDTSENAGFIVRFSAADEDRRYSTYSMGNREQPTSVPEPPRLSFPKTRSRATSTASRKSLTLTPKSIFSPLTSGSTPATPDTPTTPIPIVEHAEVNPDAVEFFAFKALPREFVARRNGVGADVRSLSSGSDSEDEDEEDVALESNETCRATVDRIARRISEQCVRAGGGEGGNAADLVVERDIVSVQDAENATSLLSRMDYAVKRFLWL